MPLNNSAGVYRLSRREGVYFDLLEDLGAFRPMHLGVRLARILKSYKK